MCKRVNRQIGNQLYFSQSTIKPFDCKFAYDTNLHIYLRLGMRLLVNFFEFLKRVVRVNLGRSKATVAQ